MSTAELAGQIGGAFEARLLEVHTGLPGVVKSYDLAKGTADIDLSVPINGEKISTLKSVRIGFYQTALCFIGLPIKVGDFCYVFFAEHSLAAWRASKGAFQYVDDPARHHLNGAWALPVLYPDSAVAPAHADNLVIGFHSGVQIHVKPNGGVDIMNATGGVDIDGDLNVQGDITATGEVTAKSGTPGQVSLSTHTHPTGTGPSGPPTPGS